MLKNQNIPKEAVQLYSKQEKLYMVGGQLNIATLVMMKYQPILS